MFTGYIIVTKNISDHSGLREREHYKYVFSIHSINTSALHVKKPSLNFLMLKNLGVFIPGF
jgi:hypothetical protein